MKTEILHDCATHAEELTGTEQVILAKWYTELERDESETIFGSDSPSESMASENEQNIVLQQQIDGLLNQLTEKTELL